MLRSLITLTALGFTLAACSPGPEYPVIQPVPEAVTESHCVRFTGKNHSLSLEDKQEIRDFLANVPVEAADRVEIAGNICSNKDHNHLKTLRSFLVREGIARKVTEIVKDPEMPRGCSLITVNYMRATTPACEGWGRDSTNFDNSRVTNFGCTTARNHAAQIARPSDLNGGRSDIRPDGDRSAVVVQT